jgi:hypothetical protein
MLSRLRPAFTARAIGDVLEGATGVATPGHYEHTRAEAAVTDLQT